MSEYREYWNTKKIVDRYDISPRTLYRRIARRYRPFPSPIIKSEGGMNLFCRKSVLAWEEIEILNTQKRNGKAGQ